MAAEELGSLPSSTALGLNGSGVKWNIRRISSMPIAYTWPNGQVG